MVVDNANLRSIKPAIVMLDAISELPLESSQKYKFTISSIQTPSVLGWKEIKLELPCGGRVVAVGSFISSSMGVALVNSYSPEGSRASSPASMTASNSPSCSYGDHRLEQEQIGIFRHHR